MTTVARKSEAVLYDEKTSTISAYGPARSIKGTPLSPDEPRDIDACWRASLYLCLGMLTSRKTRRCVSHLRWSRRSHGCSNHWGSDAG